jgi:hypothetical protein
MSQIYCLNIQVPIFFSGGLSVMDTRLTAEQEALLQRVHDGTFQGDDLDKLAVLLTEAINGFGKTILLAQYYGSLAALNLGPDRVVGDTALAELQAGITSENVLYLAFNRCGMGQFLTRRESKGCTLDWSAAGGKPLTFIDPAKLGM